MAFITEKGERAGQHGRNGGDGECRKGADCNLAD